MILDENDARAGMISGNLLNSKKYYRIASTGIMIRTLIGVLQVTRDVYFLSGGFDTLDYTITEWFSLNQVLWYFTLGSFLAMLIGGILFMLWFRRACFNLQRAIV